MAIPLAYNTRNLRVRMGATVMTALGIALTVSIAVLIMALLTGLERAFVASGDPRNVLVMRQGADSEMMSFITHEQAQTLKVLPGVARNDRDDPLMSGDTVVVIALPRRDGTGEVNVTVRGVSPGGVVIRPGIKLVEGRWFSPGLREVAVSTSVSARFANAKVGDQMKFGKGTWAVVGVFDAGGNAHQSEIWADTNLMGADFDRPGYSSVLLRAQDAAAAEALVRRVSEDQRLKLQGVLETAYWQEQTRSGMTIRFVGTLVAIIMAIGSCFAAMNTMYAAVAYRTREVATLRLLGFSRLSILSSFLIESVLVALLGGAVGIILMLPFQGLTTGTSNMASYSEIIFAMRITPVVAAWALVFAVTMGVLGGLAPAWHAARKNIVAALRD